MRLLYPESRATSPQELASGLRLGDKAPPDRPYVVLNMVSSLDGKATIDWRTKGLSTELARHPLAVVISGRLDLGVDLPLLNEPEQRVVIATGSDASLPELGEQVVYERVGDDLPLLAARLRQDHGVRSVVCEGGPTLNAHLLAAGLVDELWLTLNPKLAGGAAAL